MKAANGDEGKPERVMPDSPLAASPRKSLKYCGVCVQMTNHDDKGRCLKCKANYPKQKKK